MLTLAAIPSPGQGVWQLGPLPIRAYALFIIAGIVAALFIGERRWVARGGVAGTVTDIATWVVPFGIVGGRLYHVITSPEAYFGSGGNPVDAFKIWEGGLGIWGAIALGGVGAWIACHRRGIPLPAFADAVAPGVAVAQAIGRFGNYFNQELFGRPTDLPWALRIDPDNRPEGYERFDAFHPTFLYESLWNVGVALLVVVADRRYRLGHGRAFALYVAGYTSGRLWIELLRIDEANTVFGLRLNVWTSLLVFTGAVIYFVVSSVRRPGREVLLIAAEHDGAGSPGVEVADVREAGRSGVDGEVAARRSAASPAVPPTSGDRR